MGRLIQSDNTFVVEMHLFKPDRAIMTANLRGFVEWQRLPDTPMPDPIKLEDARWLLSQAPKGQALSQLVERQFIANPTGAPWGARKDDRSCREMVMVSWPAQLCARLLLHERADELVERQRPRSFAGRIALYKPGGTDIPVLTTKPFGPAFGAWKQEILRLARLDPEVVLKTDIRRFYPSLSPRVVGETLSPVLGSELSFDLRMLLERIQIDSGIGGLPITAESSGWLANQVLFRLDQRLEAIPGLTSNRWSDDEFLIDGVPSLLEHAQSIRTQELRALGLRSSEKKTVRSWLSGTSGRQLLLSSNVSQGDINSIVESECDSRLWLKLAAELADGQPNKSRLNRLFGRLSKTQVRGFLPLWIINRMLEDPVLWECSSIRASGFLAVHASAEQVAKMVLRSVDMNGEGMVCAEQVVALLQATVNSQSHLLSESRGLLADQLLRLARTGSCVPVRMWARYAAYALNPERVTHETIDSGEFEWLHPFEQRVAISFADPRRHRWWLEKQIDEGSWPTTAEWQMKKAR